MRTREEIHREIDRASERRTGLWNILSQGHDPAAAQELKELNERLGRLWDEHRAFRATVRFGERDTIIHRARAEERLERAA